MPTVQELIGIKGSLIHTIDAGATVLSATKKMNDARIGALIVVSGDQIVGMFTERDVLRRVVAEERSPADATVGEVMTEDVICCSPTTPLEDASGIMKNHRVRHLPVCDEDGSILGLVSIGDLNGFHASHQEQTIHFLNDYIYGRV